MDTKPIILPDGYAIAKVTHSMGGATYPLGVTRYGSRLTCYRLYTNERGFDDWERYPKYDLETTDDSDAVIHMSDCADREMGFEKFAFRVESWEE